MFENVFTSTQLKTNLREVKEAAMRDVVYITENGVIAYVLCSVEIWNREMERAGRLGRWQGMVEVRLGSAGRERDGGVIEFDGDHGHVRTSLAFLGDAARIYGGVDGISAVTGMPRPPANFVARRPGEPALVAAPPVPSLPDLSEPAYHGLRAVVEYVGTYPDAGLELPDFVRREAPFGDHACKFYCDGHDIIYEYDSSTGEVLLCGLVKSLDEFDLPMS